MATNWLTDSNTALGCKFEDGAGSGTVADGSTHSNTGTVNNSNGITQGATGKYTLGMATTAGNNSKVSFPAAAANNNLANISICVWLKNNSFGIAGTSSDKSCIYNKGYRSGALCFQTTNQLRWAEHFGGGTINYDTTNGSCTTGANQHYAVTYGDRSTSSPTVTPIFYVDGVTQTTSASGSPFLSRDDDSGNPCMITQDSIDAGETDSTYDEFLLYSGILTSTDINGIKDNGIDGSQGGTSITYSASKLNIAIRQKTITFSNATSIKFYNRFKANLFKGYVDFGGSGSHGIKCGLLTSSYTFNPDDNYWNNLSTLYETSGTGYAANGVALSNFYIAVSSGNQYAYFTSDAARWNNSSFSARYAVFYDSTLTNKDLIMCIDLGRTWTTTNSSFLLKFPITGLMIIT